MPRPSCRNSAAQSWTASKSTSLQAQQFRFKRRSGSVVAGARITARFVPAREDRAQGRAEAPAKT